MILVPPTLPIPIALHPPIAVRVTVPSRLHHRTTRFARRVEAKVVVASQTRTRRTGERRRTLRVILVPPTLPIPIALQPAVAVGVAVPSRLHHRTTRLARRIAAKVVVTRQTRTRRIGKGRRAQRMILVPPTLPIPIALQPAVAVGVAVPSRLHHRTTRLARRIAAKVVVTRQARTRGDGFGLAEGAKAHGVEVERAALAWRIQGEAELRAVGVRGKVEHEASGDRLHVAPRGGRRKAPAGRSHARFEGPTEVIARVQLHHDARGAGPQITTYRHRGALRREFRGARVRDPRRCGLHTQVTLSCRRRGGRLHELRTGPLHRPAGRPCLEVPARQSAHPVHKRPERVAGIVGAEPEAVARVSHAAGDRLVPQRPVQDDCIVGRRRVERLKNPRGLLRLRRHLAEPAAELPHHGSHAPCRRPQDVQSVRDVGVVPGVRVRMDLRERERRPGRGSVGHEQRSLGGEEHVRGPLVSGNRNVTEDGPNRLPGHHLPGGGRGKVVLHLRG